MEYERFTYFYVREGIYIHSRIFVGLPIFGFTDIINGDLSLPLLLSLFPFPGYPENGINITKLKNFPVTTST